MLHLALDALCADEGVDPVVGLKMVRTRAGKPGSWRELLCTLRRDSPCAGAILEATEAPFDAWTAACIECHCMCAWLLSVERRVLRGGIRAAPGAQAPDVRTQRGYFYYIYNLL